MDNKAKSTGISQEDKNERRKVTCTFTGHRPERLDRPEEEVKEWLREHIEKAIGEGYTYFISGMQRGVDIWAAEEVLRLKKENPSLHLIAASPFKGAEDRWEYDWQRRYRSIIKAADETHFVAAKPGRAAFMKRNEWMVDRASRLLAVFTGALGGTKYTIDYAKKNNLEIEKI